nr:hypothetical protein BaRGS_031961 [Batillaria attramentaria]
MAIAFTPFVVPPLLAAVGFTPGGIAAGSVAAKLMSYSWVTGIGVSVVSAFQSVGAAGCGVKLYTAAALAGYCTGRGIADGHKDNEPGVVSAFQSVGAAGCGMKLYTAAALTGYFTGRGIADGHKDIEPGRVGPAERVDEE